MGIINKTKNKIKMEGAEETKIDTINAAIKNVIQKSMAVDGLVKGLNQVGKALDRKDAYLCILAKDCDDPKYKKLITALAKQNKVPLIEVDSRQDLGQWLGQCKYDKDGVPRRPRELLHAPSRTTEKPLTLSLSSSNTSRNTISEELGVRCHLEYSYSLKTF